MLWFQTFGGPVVFGADGQPTLSAAQRRNLGLLSVLAVAGPGGIARDKVVGLLWPEVSPRRARHSLTQSLYMARKSLDCEELFEGIEDIRLNPARIKTDVDEFEAALRGGMEEQAVRLYRGPFLDQLFPPTPLFERWLDAQRAGFEERIVAAYKMLIDRAITANDYANAVTWLRGLSGIRPADSDVTLQLMNALVQTGDTSAAVQRAHLHSKILRDDYELDPDQRVIEFAEQLRTTRQTVVLAPPQIEVVSNPDSYGANEPGRARPSEPPSTLAPSSVALTLNTDVSHVRSRRAVRWPQWAIACAIVISATIVFIARRSRLEITALSQRTIVAPFRIVGGDASLDYLREGMVELLSAHLDDESAAATPDAGTVIQAWRRAGVNRSGAPSRDSMVSLAARMGAERVIIGSIVATQRRAIMSASLITAASREINAVGRVEGPVDSLTALVDQLAAQLLAAEAGLPAVAAKRTSPSLPALRAFLAGSSAYNGGDYAIAADRFQRALDFDSSFAVAAFRLGLTARHLNAFQLERHALNRAWQFRADLNRRDGAHLLALLGPRYPDVSSQSETLVAWEDALRIAPDRAEVLYGFASYLTERNGYQLSDHQRERAVAALDRALAVDPSYGHVHLLRFMLSDSASNAPNGFPPFLRWRLALVREDTAELRQTRDSLIRFGPGNLRAIAAASQFDGIDLRTGTRAIAVLQARGPSASEALDLLLAAHSFRILTSDAGGTSDILREMQRVNPATGAHLRLRVLDSLYASTDSTAASVAAQELARDLAANQSSSAADACVLGQWQLMRGDTVALRSTMNVLHASNNNEPTLVGTPATFCVPLLNAALAVYQGQPNARDRVLALDTLVLTSTASGDLSTYGHIAVSRLHRRVGNSQAALQAIRRRPYLAGGWPRYLATTHLEEGELAQLTGDTAGAVTAYSRYMALRSGSPDPRFDVIVALRDSLASQLRNIAH